ncbi:MAG: T9SS type A sorting domain-containing protein, partial [Gelidibacter sp.]|nr:T9SS type A sorting domain-containing protein [Gelidibacter sp.]
SAGKVKSSKETAEAEDVFPRIYLNYSSPKGFHRQLLVAFIPNTSEGIDIGYDAINGETFAEDMSWKANEKKLVIQAVPTLNEQRILPLYLKLAIDGIAKIGVDIMENMPRATKIFIKDNTTGETFDITEKPFEILLKAGVYDNRFAITFKVILVPDENAVLMNEDILVTVKNPLIAEDVAMVQNEQPVNIGIQVFMNNNISELQINNVTNSEILSINLFNNVGQLVNSWNKNLNKREISLPVHTPTGIYNVQITTNNGTTVKKIKKLSLNK